MSNFSVTKSTSWREEVTLDEMMMTCTRSTRLVLAHRNTPRVEMSLHSDTLSLFRTNYSLFLPLNSVCLTRKQQISILLSLVSSDRDSNSRATGLEASSLTIIPSLQFIYFFIEKLPLCARNDTFGCLSQIIQKQHFHKSYMISFSFKLVYGITKHSVSVAIRSVWFVYFLYWKIM